MSELKIVSDGGSRGNPGMAAGGFLIMSMNDIILFEEGVFFGVKTNNQAEYMALIKALEKAIEYGADKIHVQSDSQLMISQLTGEFRVKNKKLKPLYGIVKKLEGKFDNVEYDHSPRDNPDIKQADKLVNQTLNREEKRQFKKKKY